MRVFQYWKTGGLSQTFGLHEPGPGFFSSRDLSRRATFVYWEACLRFVTALILVPAGVFGDIGLIAAILGLGDLVIGLVYVFSA